MGEVWNRLFDEGGFVERLKPGFVELAGQGLPPPDEFGLEVEEGNSYRIAEAVWNAAAVVLLTVNQAEFAADWRTAGFRVVEEGDNWWLAVVQALMETTT